MNAVLYLQTDKDRKITQEIIKIKDVASLFCEDPKIQQRCEQIVVRRLPKKNYGRYPISVIELVEAIKSREKNLDICHIGEADFILTYAPSKEKNVLWDFCKILAVCLITFSGSVFSIMTFNTDVDIESLFERVCTLIMGEAQKGMPVLVWGYSLGIGLGVIFFFNHFGKWKLTSDPTPMEVEMRTYEDDVDRTILEWESRRKS